MRRSALVASVPVLYALGLLRFGVVLVVAFGIGVFFTPHHSARLTLLPVLAGDDGTALARANSVLQAVNRSALLLGPPLAGVLISVMGAASVLWIDVTTFALSFALVFFFVRVNHSAPPLQEPFGFVTGLRTTLNGSVLRPWTIAVTFFEAVWQFMVAAIPLLTYLYFDGDASLVGVLMAVIGVGAISGNLLSMRLSGRFDHRRLILGATVAQTVLLWCTAAATRPWSFGLVLLTAGFALGIAEGPMTATQVSRIPQAVRAQTLGAFFTLTLLGGAAGTLMAAPVLTHLNQHLAFLTPALVHTFGALVLTVALSRLSDYPVCSWFWVRRGF